jgi:hypothetical protein
MKIVYQHINLKTDKVFYVGIGKDEKRAYAKTGRSEGWFNVVLNDGYRVEITHRELIQEEAESIEKYLICFWREYNGIKSLVNVTNGGAGTSGVKMSESVKMIVKEKQKEYFLRPGVKEKQREIAKKCFQDEKGHPKNAQKVINTLTGEIFDTILIAATVNGYKYPMFRANLNGQTKINHTHFIYLKNQSK